MRQTSVREIVYSAWMLNLKYTFRKTVGVVGFALFAMQQDFKGLNFGIACFLASDITPRCTSKEVSVSKKVD